MGRKFQKDKGKNMISVRGPVHVSGSRKEMNVGGDT